MLRIAQPIGGAASLLSLVSLVACTDPAGPGDQPGFFGLVQGPNPFLVQASPALPADSCPPFRESSLPSTRRPIAASGASIALPSTALATRFDDERGIVYRIPGEGFIAVSYGDDVGAQLDGSDGRSRRPVTSVSLLNVCDVTVDGRPARLFLEFATVFRLDGTTVPGPIIYQPYMLLFTTTPAGRRVNIALLGAGTISVAVPPPAEGERNFAVGRLLSRAASIRW